MSDMPRRDQGLSLSRRFRISLWPKGSCNIDFEALRQVFSHDTCSLPACLYRGDDRNESADWLGVRT